MTRYYDLSDCPILAGDLPSPPRAGKSCNSSIPGSSAYALPQRCYTRRGNGQDVTCHGSLRTDLKCITGTKADLRSMVGLFCAERTTLNFTMGLQLRGREEMRPQQPAAILGFALFIAGCATTRDVTQVRLLTPETMAKWSLTPGYANTKPWVLENGVYQGFGSWVAHADVFGDFELTCEFLYTGAAQGGIVIRGNPESRKPWEEGYELDIHSPSNDPSKGHIHFPVRPRPYGGNALFELRKWHAVRIIAKGPSVVVFLDGKEALAFTDAEFSQGSICMEGEKDGVKYRNLTVVPLGE